MGKKLIDHTGQRFGKLFVVGKSDKKKGKYTGAFWECKCDCGNVVIVPGSSLRSGETRSCGCLRKAMVGELKRTHGMCRTRIYRIWQAMIKRCCSPGYERYSEYGGRGISVCDEWRNDFLSFYNWSMENGYSDELTIDRIEVNGNYEPENCRWATYKEQGNNTRRNHYITFDGETHTMCEWAKIKGMKYQTLAARINIYHWDIEKALNTPVKS